MHTFPIIGSKHQETVVIGGTFFPAGTGAPTYGTTGKRGWTVARTSTGLFTITLDDVFPGLVTADATLRLATGDDKFAQLGTISLSSRTIQVRVWDISAAAVADVTADANNAIHWWALVTQSAVGLGQ